MAFVSILCSVVSESEDAMLWVLESIIDVFFVESKEMTNEFPCFADVK